MHGRDTQMEFVLKLIASGAALSVLHEGFL